MISPTARQLVLGIIVVNLGISALTIIIFLSARGTDAFPRQLFRILVHCLLYWQLYRGANWARWVLGILFAVGGTMSMVSGITGSDNAVGFILMGLIYLGSAAILFFVPTVRAYFVQGD